MRLHTINIYDWRLQLMLAAEALIDANSWAKALPPWQMATTTCAEIRELRERYWMAGCCMSPGGEIRRNWSPRLGCGGNGSIEFRNWGLEERYQLGIPFFCFFSSLLFSILYYFVGSRPCINAVNTGFTTCRFQSMGGGVSPCAGSAERSPWVVAIRNSTFQFVRVCTRHDCLMLSFPFHFSCMAYAAREVCT